MIAKLKQLKGFAILGMLFILVILAVAGGYMVKMGAINMSLVTLQLLDSQAHYAAQSALEIARNQWETNPQQCPKQTIVFADRGTSLNGFEVSLDCETMVSATPEEPHFHAIYMTAIAKKGKWGTRDYVCTQLNQWFTLDF